MIAEGDELAYSGALTLTDDRRNGEEPEVSQVINIKYGPNETSLERLVSSIIS